MTDLNAEAPGLRDLARSVAAGRCRQAIPGLQVLLDRDGEDMQVLVLLAEALRRVGRPGDALRICQRATAIDDHAAAWLETGRALNNLGRIPAAAAALEKARALDPGNAAVHHDLGHVSRRMGDEAAALQGFREAARLRPRWGKVWYSLGMLEMNAGSLSAARDHLEQAVALGEAAPATLTALGVVHHRLGECDAAGRCYRQAIDADPGHAPAWANLGVNLQDSGQLTQSIDAYRRAIALEPNDHQAAVHLGEALLAAGEPGSALTEAEKVLSTRPVHAGALAVKALALFRTGRREAYRALVDPDSLIMIRDMPVPAGFADMDAFNDALCRHVLAHPTLRYEPAGHATRHGQHTANLLRNDKGPVAMLEAAANQAVAEFCGRLRTLVDHPLGCRQPESWRLTLWSVVMHDGGHQLAHIHPTAWLSGVYYARVPAGVSARDAGQAGWIEFGRPPPELAGDADFPLKRLLPVPGRMFLFPAYLYHETVPFSSETPRISLAFDVVPAGGANISRSP